MQLNRYKDSPGGAGITGYKFVPYGIKLPFKHKELYQNYDSKRGRHHIKQMETLERN